ncbi:MAG: hypothetical protein HYT79_11380 [Elusimicrobia bacterium]|nr:hypothetical protein [Elusimicrobiota bacterium]
MAYSWKTFAKTIFYGIALAAVVLGVFAMNLIKKRDQASRSPLRHHVYELTKESLAPLVAKTLDLHRGPLSGNAFPKAGGAKKGSFAGLRAEALPESASFGQNTVQSATRVYRVATDGLWEWLDVLRRDPKRELLMSEFSWRMGRIVFYEMSPGGLVSFELVNETGKDAYLPEILCGNCPGPAGVYMERRVLEPGTRSVGIMKVANIAELKRLDLVVKAANCKAAKLRLEVPRWVF